MKKIGKEKDKDKIKLKKDEVELKGPNLFVTTVIIIITITFIFTGSSMLGLSKIFGDLGKDKIHNEDGTISIPEDAQILGVDVNEQEARNKYIGKVYGEKIQLGPKDEFNRKVQNILSYEGIPDYQKIQWIRAVYDQDINMIIGLNNAKKIGFEISKDYLIKEVGTRYYSDKEGDIDTYKMRKEQNKVNQYADMLINDLLYENFELDFFDNLPVSHKEVADNYKLDNTQVTLEYIDVLNSDISDVDLKSFYEANKENYKQYKLIRLYFKNKDIAAENLNNLKQDPSKFVEIGQQLKKEDKVINIKYDTQYYFINEFSEPQLSETVKRTQLNQVGDQVIESDSGSFIFLVEQINYGNFEDQKTYEKLKKDYMAKNIDIINKNNKERAENIYHYAIRNDLVKASKEFKYELKKSSPFLLMGYNMPNVNPDETDDLNYMIKVFKSKVNDILEPFKHENGYMIAKVLQKEEITEGDIDALYDDLVKRYSSKKTQDLEGDYFYYERKKTKIIDNFRFVNFQLLMPKKESNQ